MDNEIKGKAKGGIARAASLTPEQRSKQSQKAAQKRWELDKKEVPRAVNQGDLVIGERTLSCAVLEDGTRVISRNAIFRAFGRTKRGRAKDEMRVLNMPSFIDAKNLQPFIDEALRGELIPIEYKAITGKMIQAGYNALILPKICDVYLTARLDNVLTKSQLPLAAVSEILVRSFSKIGIIALVDEATGYQDKRTRDALQQLLSIYLTEEKLKWAKTFPNEFYKHLFRLRGWQYNPLDQRKPKIVGKLTNQIVYKKLPPGVLEKLREMNPIKNKKTWRRGAAHFQFLSSDIGQPDLRDHFVQLMPLMRASEDWTSFVTLLDKAIPDPDIKLRGEQQTINFDKKKD